MIDGTNYEQIAPEYYNPEHVTCRFFEQATAAYFNDHPGLRAEFGNGGRTLDVGSGAGLSELYLGEDHSDVLVHVDLNRGMLQQAQGSKVQADAMRLPFHDKSFDKVTSFLFDPFYSPEYWREVHRVLADDGIFIGTLPSHAFAARYRRSANLPAELTRFRTQNAGDVLVPSRTLSHAAAFDDLYGLDALFPEAGIRSIFPHTEDIPNPILAAANIAQIAPEKLEVVTLITAFKKPRTPIPIHGSVFDPATNDDVRAMLIERNVKR